MTPPAQLPPSGFSTPASQDRSQFWWGTPSGWTDYDLYLYNRAQQFTDDEIREMVKDNFIADPGIAWSEQERVNIEVQQGAVTLSGEVRNPRTKPLMYVDAYWTMGVRDVENKVTIKKRPDGQQQQNGKQQQQSTEEEQQDKQQQKKEEQGGAEKKQQNGERTSASELKEALEKAVHAVAGEAKGGQPNKRSDQKNQKKNQQQD